MRILQCVNDLDPALGGSVEAARQLGIALMQQGHVVEVVTLAEAAGDWRTKIHSLAPSATYYFFNRRLAPWMRAHAAEYDAVIVHGVWRYASVGAWLGLRGLNVPYYVFPHGMLDPWYRDAFPVKHIKKTLCWKAAEWRVLRDARAVLFTCEQERLAARATFRPWRCNERVVGLGVAPPPGDASAQIRDFFSRFPELEGKRFILLLGRIHPQKGCDLLIRAFARVAGEEPNLRLVIAGPDQIGWRAALEHIHERVTWTGPLFGAAKWGALRAADALAAPSRFENFGLSIVEALSCGLPVLISDRVGIWREIEADAAGLVASGDDAGAESLLRRWIGMSGHERRAMRANALRCYRDRYEARAFAARFAEVLACPAAGQAKRSAPPDLDLSIVTVNHGHRGVIGKCFDSLFSLPDAARFEALLVDNTPEDGSADEALARHPEVRVLRNSKRRGFAANANTGLRTMTRGRYVLLMNPDVICQPGLLDELAGFMDANPDAGIAAPMLFNTDGTLQPSCRKFPTPLTLAIRALRIEHLLHDPRVIRDYLMSDWDHRTAANVDWVTGAVAIVRRSAIEQVGLMDERFFLYWEDLDWCIRMWRAGWRVCYVPRARAVHAHLRLGVFKPLSRYSREQTFGALRVFAKYGARPGPCRFSERLIREPAFPAQ